MSEPRGALFFWNDEPHVTGYLIIGNDEYELAGVKRSKIRMDLTGRKKEPVQTDMFDERGGHSNGECDQS